MANKGYASAYAAYTGYTSAYGGYPSDATASAAAAAAGWTPSAEGWVYTGTPSGYYAYGYGNKDNLRKTQLCKTWETQGPDACPYGVNCNYAHGIEELRQTPVAIQSQAYHKTRLCKNFASTGVCQYGDKCNFAHGETDLRDPNASFHSAITNQMELASTGLPPGPADTAIAATAAAMMGIGPQVPQFGKRPVDTEKAQTKLCRSYTALGKCSYNDKCAFIHDDDAHQANLVLTGKLPLTAMKVNPYFPSHSDIVDENGEPVAKKSKHMDKFDYYGESVAEKLRFLPAINAVTLMHEINKVIEDGYAAAKEEKAALERENKPDEGKDIENGVSATNEKQAEMNFQDDGQVNNESKTAAVPDNISDAGDD